MTERAEPAAAQQRLDQHFMMMDLAGWAAENGAEEVQDYAAGEDTYSARNTNGTGPFVLQSREADVRTVMTANPDYWGIGEFPLDVSEIIFTPIQNPSTRVAALLTGEVDFIQDVPVQDLQRVTEADGIGLATAPQNRSIFFGLNVGDDDLGSDNVDGANPFADQRVREAMNIAINREAIQQVVDARPVRPVGHAGPAARRRLDRGARHLPRVRHRGRPRPDGGGGLRRRLHRAARLPQ